MSVENSASPSAISVMIAQSLALRSAYFLPSLSEREVDLREQALKGALEGLVLDVLEARLQRVEQFAVLRAGQVGDAGPEVLGLDDVVHLAAHLLLELGHVVRVVRVPDRQRRRAGRSPIAASG